MKKEDKLTYGEAMEQLGSILERLNNEELDIDVLTSEVKRATELIALCRGKLTAAKEQVGELFKEEA
ncbi:MAG: exodeoxyribonuclease VII small subunit [Rikenellaceae bacterium]|nr:exodeoxyribonuclease VII small subunit [Rikenellaceae bacterium]